jgi:pyruvate/2-oxoglutarate dehydrogenase complex dihydrolipoamide dehydrogenase (E3) component
VVVIGGGPAGTASALRAQDLGARVALVESRPRLGGTCTNDGCVPVRALAHAARLVREAGRLRECGVDLRGAVAAGPDFGTVMERAVGVVREVHDRRDLSGSLARAGVRVIEGAGDARFVNPNEVRLPDGRGLAAGRFIVCVGGHARRPVCPGGELAVTFEQLWSLRERPGRLVVIGAGATGCKLASILNALGTRVTMLDKSERILNVLDAAASAALCAAFERRGIEVVGRIERVERIERVGEGLRVTYRTADGDARTAEADLVAVAMGWPGNAHRVNPGAAGIEVDARGYVARNDRMQSVSAAHVFAAGDGGGPGMLVQAALHDAAVAAENAVRGPHRVRDALVLPHGGFTDPEYGVVGLTEAEARRRRPAAADVVSASVAYRELDRAVIDGRPDGFCKLVVDRPTRRVLGAHVVGEDATEVVQIVAVAMTAGMSVDALAQVAFSYPTYTGVVGLAAREAVRALDGATGA